MSGSRRTPLDVMSRTHAEELRATLGHCATQVPWYDGIEPPDPSLPAPDATLAALARFPVLRKAELRRAFPHGLVPRGERLPDLLRRGIVEFVGTSGTTAERVQVLWHQPWWDAQERDGFALHPLTDSLCGIADYREAVLTTPVCSGNLCHVGALPMHERIVDDHILFLNQTPDPALWRERDIHRIADELDEFRPHAIEADPAYLAAFVTRLRALGRSVHQPAFVDHSYSFPAAVHLASIRAAFSCPVLDAYGSTECGFAFMQCHEGRLHHNSAWTHAELLPLDAMSGLEEQALLLLTTLRNPWLNLVRFDTGDIVRPSKTPCPCGRNDGLVLDALEGRRSDLLRSIDGRLLTTRAIDRAVGPVPGVVNYRVRQRADDDVDVELVPAIGAGPVAAATLEGVGRRLAALLGRHPHVRESASVPVEASGKYRLAAASHFDPSECVRT